MTHVNPASREAVRGAQGDIKRILRGGGQTPGTKNGGSDGDEELVSLVMKTAPASGMKNSRCSS